MSERTVADPPPPPTEPIEGSPPEPDGLPLDVVYDVLSNGRRRRTLRYLLAGPGHATLGEIAEHIAGIENDKPVNALTSTERKRVYICLYQLHFPKMDDAGVIDFDDDRKTVELGGNAEQVKKFMPEDEDAESSDETSGWTAVLGGVSRALGGIRRIVKR